MDMPPNFFQYIEIIFCYTMSYDVLMVCFMLFEIP